MSPLTPAQRERLVERIAESLLWAESGYKDTYRARARVVVRDLESVAVHGASDKRAAETCCRPSAEEAE